MNKPVKEIKVGDIICACGRTFQVAEIISACNLGDRDCTLPGMPIVKDNWYLEFLDSRGIYRYWKQGLDGGDVISKH